MATRVLCGDDVITSEIDRMGTRDLEVCGLVFSYG